MRSGQSDPSAPAAPVTLPSLSWRQWLVSQGSAFVFNVATCAIYLVTADDMFHQLARVESAPRYIVNQRSWMMGNVSDFSVPWHVYLFATYLVLTGVFCVTNQFSMPHRIEDLLGWQEEQSHDATWKQIASVFSATWKTVVSNMSLWTVVATNSPWQGFYLGLALVVLAVPGNVFGQLSNFMGGSAKICRSARFSERTIKMIAGFCAASYVLSGSALYFDSFNRSLHKLNWIDKDLTELEGVSFWLVMVCQVVGNLIFSGMTYLSYYPRFKKMLEPEQQNSLQVALINPQEPQASALLQETEVVSEDQRHDEGMSTVAISVPNPIETEVSYHFGDRFGPLEFFAANYKVGSTYLSTLVMIDMVYKLDRLKLAQGICVALITMIQLCNYFSQQTFYAETTQQLRARGARPGENGLYLAWTRFSVCCRRGTEEDNRQNSASNQRNAAQSAEIYGASQQRNQL